MRSDPPSRAGGSAADGFLVARSERRRRRSAQAAVLVLGALGASVALVALGLAPGGVVITVSLLVAWWVRPQPDPARWVRGADGEAATAALLEGLPARRWAVLHDRAVPGSRANLDHLVIGPTGVWMIDTKAFRAPLHAGWRSVRAGEHVLDTGPARWEASVVADRLGIEVRPLVAVHGDGLPSRGRRVEGVPVLPAASVLRRLRRRRGSAHLRRADVEALALDCDQMFPTATERATLAGRRSAQARDHRTQAGRP